MDTNKHESQSQIEAGKKRPRQLPLPLGEPQAEGFPNHFIRGDSCLFVDHLNRSGYER